MSDESRLHATIFVGGLAPSITAPLLYSFFEPFGEISDISLPKPDQRTGPSTAHSSQLPSTHKGFGYIEFGAASDAADAIDNMDQAELGGRVIKVAKAKPSQRIKEGEGAGEGFLGARTALWEQEGYLAKHTDGGGVEAGEDGGMGGNEEGEEDPMQGLQGLDVAGPRTGA